MGGEGGGKAFFLKSVTHPTVMKLGTVIPNPSKKDPKKINHMTHILTSAGISIFHQKLATFVMSRNTDIDCI